MHLYNTPHVHVYIVMCLWVCTNGVSGRYKVNRVNLRLEVGGVGM